MSSPRRLIAAARSRIRRRNLIRGAAGGAWVGAALAVVALGVSRLWWPLDPVSPWMVAVAAAVLPVGVGVLVGALRPVLGERELALLVDRALGTDEVLVTLLHLEEQGHAPEAVRTDLERRVASLGGLGRGVRTGAPITAWLAPVAAALAFLVLLIPARPTARAGQDTDTTPVQDEADRLQEALDELEAEHDAPLPDDVQAQADELMEQLSDGTLSEAEAAEKIGELQEALDQWEAELEASGREDLDALQDAADALRETGSDAATEQALEELADALEDRDLEGAAQAMDELMEQVSSSGAQEQGELGEALDRAGEALQQAGSESLQQAGEALQQAGQELSEAASEGRTAEGQTGQGQAERDQARQRSQDAAERAKQRLQDLKQQLEQAQDLQERLRQDQDKLRRSQETNGALEAARQRLGGEAEVASGQCEDGACEQGGQPGQGAGQAGAPCPPGETCEGGMAVAAGTDTSGSRAGEGHTWEDAGTFDTTEPHQDANRLSDRTSGESIDDFEAFYDPVRMDGAGTLMTPVEGVVDERGHIDELPMTRTDGDETAARPLLDIPASYKDAADEAITDERVPPGYRAAVKDYFDSME